eukprot:11741408-Alexandrium_andersonii.AAC.1
MTQTPNPSCHETATKFELPRSRRQFQAARNTLEVGVCFMAARIRCLLHGSSDSVSVSWQLEIGVCFMAARNRGLFRLGFGVRFMAARIRCSFHDCWIRCLKLWMEVVSEETLGHAMSTPCTEHASNCGIK